MQLICPCLIGRKDLMTRSRRSRCRTRVAMQLICPCLIGRKDLMTRSYPAAVGDTANAGSDKIFVAMPDTTLAPAIDPGGMMDRPGVVSRKKLIALPRSRCWTRVAMQLICPCLIGRKD